MTQNPTIGDSYPKGNVTALAELLLKYKNNSVELLSCKKESLRLAHEQYNWESESRKFLSLIAKTLTETPIAN